MVNPWLSTQWRIDSSGSRPLIVIWEGDAPRDFRLHTFQSQLLQCVLILRDI